VKLCVQVPNFGFVVFDSEEAVEKALASRPIMLEGNHRWGHREKKRMEDSRIGPWEISIVEWKKVVIGASVADPGYLSRILNFVHPGFRISDPGSKNCNKIEG
jgi:hypothetical protein